MQIDSAKNLTVYELSYDLAMEIFEITKKVPSELTSACAEIGRMIGGMTKKSESFLTSLV